MRQGLIQLETTLVREDALDDTQAAVVADALIEIMNAGLHVCVGCSTPNLQVVLENRVRQGLISASQLRIYGGMNV